MLLAPFTRRSWLHARVLCRSEVQEMLNIDHFPLDSHLVEYATYPIGPRLMTPYRDNGHLTPKQKQLNSQLSKARVTIDRAFGPMNNLFRRLFRVEIERPDIIVAVIIMARIFHNACPIWSNAFEEPKIVYGQDEQSATEHSSAETRRLGTEKRKVMGTAL